MAEIIGITIAIAQITPAIIEYIPQETSSSDSWSASLDSLTDLLVQYERQLQQVAHALERAATSKREALKWPFERKAVAETLTNMERYKNTFLLALQTVQTEVSDSIRRGIQDIGSDVRQSREAVEWLRDSQQDKDYQAMLQWVSPLNFHLVHNDNLQRRHGDALDECADEVKDSLLNDFGKLQRICSLKLLFTLRPGTITGKYISSRIASERRTFTTLKKKPDLVALTINTITASSRGMFLLARLHLDSIARVTSAAALKTSLQRLPRQLNTTYDEALRRIEDQDEEHAALAKKVLAWILYASRSLTIVELQHALAAESTESPQGVDEEFIINPDDIIYSCAGLVTLDQKTNVIRMVHYSAQEPFTSADKLVDFKQNEETGSVHSIIGDAVTGQQITVVSRYLGGADGGHSTVANKLQLPFNNTPGGGLALNVLCQADLTPLLVHFQGLIHVLPRPDKPQPDFCAFAIARFVKSFTEWVLVLLIKPGATKVTASQEEIVAHVQDLMGDSSVQAGPSLLESFTLERQPVGQRIFKRANDTGRMHAKLLQLMEVPEPDIQKKQPMLERFKEDSEEDATMRARFRKLIEDLD
ncbi:MAG: hypothetical protein Q9171_001995 [Xanthocarpia ochracea]